MGQLHNELRRGPLSNALSGILGDTRGGGLERYGETLQPIVDLWDRPEWALLRGEYLWSTQRLVGPAVAAELAAVALSLPLRATGGEWIMVVEGATVRNVGTAQDIRVGLIQRATVVATLAAAAANPVLRDERAGRNAAGATVPPPAIEAWEGSDGAAIAGTWEAARTVVDVYGPYFSAPWIIKAGTAIVWQSETANVAFHCNAWGTIRRPLPGETGTFGGL